MVNYHPQHAEYGTSHERPSDLNPETNGPFLDDIRKAEEDAYRFLRNKNKVVDRDTDGPEPSLQYDEHNKRIHRETKNGKVVNKKAAAKKSTTKKKSAVAKNKTAKKAAKKSATNRK